MPVKSKDSGKARPTSTRHTGPAKEQIEGLLEQGKEWERLSADPNYPYFANKRGFPVGSNVGMPENSDDPQYPDISQEVAEAERATSQDTEQMDVDDSAQEQTNNPHYGECAEEDQVMEEQHQGADDDYGDDPDDDLDHGHGHDHGNGHHNGPNFRLGTAPGPRNPPDLVHATPFAGPYQSRLTKLSKGLDSKLVQRLSHVNCSYLSTPGVIPSLEQLKQHVQSLTVLIAHLSTSTKGGYIDNKNIVIPDGNGGNMPIPAFETGETYDWLNDLSAPYCNAEVHHRLPLTSIINRIEGTGRGREIRDICPLYKSDLSEPNTPSLPYATHASLIAHANEVLELLDHEYSAKGGLLAILPLAEEKEERRLAESTLLGQLILWCQRLVQRVHDLERLYANATDVLAGEALTPAQTLNKLGIDGRQAREMVYPQDRFVLTNAGEDVWQFLSRELDKQDRIADELRLNALNNQTSTDAQREGPKNPNTGISAVDITTRYFRVRNSTNSLKTIFVVPAWQEHPGVKVTRDMETKPTVVAVAHPMWPIRASTWEMQNRDLLKYAKQAKRDEEKRSHDDENHKDTVALMQLQLDLALARAQQQEQDVQNFVETNQIGPIYTELDQERKRVKKFEDRKAAFEKEQADFAAEVRARRLEWQQKIENQDKEQVKIVAELKQKESEIDAYVAAAKARKDELEAEYKNRDEQMKQTWGRACDVANKLADETQNSHAKLVGGQKAAEIRSLVEEAIDSNTSQPTSQPTIRINTDREKHILQTVKDVMVRRGETSDGQILIMQDRAEFSDLVLKEVSENFGITYNTTDQNQPHNHEQHSNGKSVNWTDQTWASHPANIPTYANLPPQVTQPEFYNSSNRNVFSGASRVPRSPPKKASAGSSTSPQITTPPQNVAASVGIPNISGYKITPVPGYIPGSGGPQFTATPVDHVVPTHADDGLTAEQRLQKEKEAVEYYRRTRSS